jgi:hypothetical protein
MPDYASIDPVIAQWAAEHRCSLFTEWAGCEARFVYLSSRSGECFQISIEPPSNEQVQVHAYYIEGPRDIEPEQRWCVGTSDLNPALEAAFDTVIEWMKPSERCFRET